MLLERKSPFNVKINRRSHNKVFEDIHKNFFLVLKLHQIKIDRNINMETFLLPVTILIFDIFYAIFLLDLCYLIRRWDNWPITGDAQERSVSRCIIAPTIPALSYTIVEYQCSLAGNKIF